MTHEAKLTKQLEDVTEKIDTLQQRKRTIQSQLDALHRRDREAHLLAVSKRLAKLDPVAVEQWLKAQENGHG